jgi:hypothetical protein
MPCVRVLLLVVLVAVIASACGSGDGPTEPSPPAGSGGSGSTDPPSGPPPPPNTTITVSATGVSPQVLTVSVGTRVTFTNSDVRPHDFSGGPDPAQPECPEIDAAGFVAPGQSRQTGTFTAARTCRYHDHAYLGVPAFTGQIVIQ